jgi:hypothetical protein
MTQPTYHPREKLARARVDIAEICGEWMRNPNGNKPDVAAEYREAIEQRIDIEVMDAVRTATGNFDDELPPAA